MAQDMRTWAKILLAISFSAAEALVVWLFWIPPVEDPGEFGALLFPALLGIFLACCYFALIQPYNNVNKNGSK